MELPADEDVVSSQNVDPRRHVPNNVIREPGIGHDAPGCAPVLIAGSEQDREAALCIGPVVFEQIAVHHNLTCILEFQQSLDCPMRALVGGVSLTPGKRFGKVIVADGDAGWHKVCDGRILSAYQNVFAGALQIIVGNGDGAGAIPTGQRLRIRADHL